MKRRALFRAAVAALVTGTVQVSLAEEIKRFGKKLIIEAGGRRWVAELEDNATVRALAARLPMTVNMADLYERELCHHLKDPLPAGEVRYRGYAVGEIIYWPPRHSLVIMYAQNGETFSMQSVGRLESGAGEIGDSGGRDFRLSLSE